MPSSQVFKTKDSEVYTTSNGVPVNEPYAAQRAGLFGPLHFRGFLHTELLAHFDREPIPERVVHAKGAGAHGYFETTRSLSDLTAVEIFQKPGNRCHATVRFSTVTGESGSADTSRDSRGFSIKQGKMDRVFNNTPIFFLHDPAKFPHFIHSQKRDPQTHLKDADMFRDFFSQNPESVHQVMILFSDRGTPDGYHQIHGYSFKLVQKDDSFVYTRIHVLADDGFKTLDEDTARHLTGENAEAIDAKTFPTWSVFVQTTTPKQAEPFRYNILDLTNVWSHKNISTPQFGKLVLNENPQNYFAEFEQIAFNPAQLVPYLEPSANPVLQSRLFSYGDTRVSYQQLPINKPIVPVANFQRDGKMAFESQGPRPNYASTIQPLRYETRRVDFEQPALWGKVMDITQKERLVQNVAHHVQRCKFKDILNRQLSVFAAVDQELSKRIASAEAGERSNPEAIQFHVKLLTGQTVF